MWYRVILVVLGALAATALALLVLPVRIVLTLEGENTRMQFGVILSPWPFIFSFPVVTRPFYTRSPRAQDQPLSARVIELLSRVRRLVTVLSRSVAPRHQIIDFTVRLSVGVDDAAATAVLAGAAHAVVWSAVGVLFSHAQRAPARADVIIKPLYSVVAFILRVSVTVQLRPVGLLRSQGLWRALRGMSRNSA
jgi:hypothetical protein